MAPVNEHGQRESADEFLDLFLPGTTAGVAKLKGDIVRLNTKNNLKLIRSVLILGETGVGKTYIAKLIAMHRCWLAEEFGAGENRKLKPAQIQEQKAFYLKSRAKSILRDSGDPFHAVNLTTLEGGLAASLLFGHRQGQFTGAKETTTGIFGQTHVRDVLLDEIGYATTDMQRRLLEVVQSGDYYRLGETKISNTPARILFATNQNLQQLVEERKFQEDLWWRLTDYVVTVPPLRERREEIVTFAQLILAELNSKLVGNREDRKLGRGGLRLSDGDLKWAEKQPWYGNLRELDRAVRRWYFYGSKRSLEDVWSEIEAHTPRPLPINRSMVAMDRSAVTSAFMLQLQGARDGKRQFKSPEDLLENLFGAVSEEAREILAGCLEELRLGEADLARMFTNKPSSVRSWRSRNY